MAGERGYTRRGYTQKKFYCGFMHKRLPLGYTRAKTMTLPKTRSSRTRRPLFFFLGFLFLETIPDEINRLMDSHSVEQETFRQITEWLRDSLLSGILHFRTIMRNCMAPRSSSLIGFLLDSSASHPFLVSLRRNPPWFSLTQRTGVHSHQSPGS